MAGRDEAVNFRKATRSKSYVADGSSLPVSSLPSVALCFDPTPGCRVAAPIFSLFSGT